MNSSTHRCHSFRLGHSILPGAVAFLAVLILLGRVASEASAAGVAQTGAAGGGIVSGEPPQVAHQAHISEEVREISTYSFSEPNPVPVLTRDRRLYPYHSFEGYSATSEIREWKVVKLENDWIEVYVLPEVGGKIWGAVVKESGHEFIYRNEVLKFRNIALRGPWTSGGIEFNFGVIGHAPSTATPVDYALKENDDGSVSCWVGSMDLPSRTQWRVEVRLPADQATFETNVLWYNPTPLEQPYYNWMTAAAFARPDLEMTMLGNAYLQHSGNALSWPVDDEGRYLPLYGNNTFDGHKSYHVVGELHDFFGGYYHDADYGFGHWARYEDMPGQKLWVWALSREGGIWEDLLTDTDGQYVEFQAGRLFVQYSPGSDVNPITQAGFDPISASRWTERWFPLEGIGGLTDATRYGAIHAVSDGGRLTVAVNAFRDVRDTLKVWVGEDATAHAGSPADPGAGGDPTLVLPVTLEALEPFEASLEISAGSPYRIQLAALELDYASDPAQRRLARPFQTEAGAWTTVPEVDQAVFQGRELMKGRRYAEAAEFFQGALSEEPWNRGALLGMAEISYRRGLYAAGLGQVNRVLQLDAYDAEANFLAGSLYRALGQAADARDAFGWAARAVAYRAASYVQLAEVMVGEGHFSDAVRYARLALSFDTASIPAWQIVAVAGRKSGNASMASEALGVLAGMDPLHPLPGAERYLATRGPAAANMLLASLGGELPDQSLMELALVYGRLGLVDDAVALLRLAPKEGDAPRNLVLRVWLARLTGDASLLATPGSPAFAFPYRTESIPVLQWAVTNDGSWVWRYLLALNLWAVGRDEEGSEAMMLLGDDPDFGPVYVARGVLRQQTRGTNPEQDFRRAVALDPELRPLHLQLIRHLQDNGQWEEALTAVHDAQARFPSDFDLDLLRARTLINLNRPLEATETLASTHVLPSENARESHRLYEQAHVLVALDALETDHNALAQEHLLAALEWPESLGQGRPYEPEERLVRFLLGRAQDRLARTEAAQESYQSVIEQTRRSEDVPGAPLLARPLSRLDLLALPSLGALGRGAELEELNRSWQTEFEGLFRGLTADLDGRMILRALQLTN